MMNAESVGDMIYTLRTCQYISKEALCKGLCSKATILQIENGVKKPDKFLLEALLQRLGKSPDKIETMLSVEDYILYTIRIEIEDALVKHDYEKVISEIEHYKKKIKKSLNLHEQYLYKINAILEMEINQNTDKSIAYLEEAIKMTFPEYELDYIRYHVLGSDEVILLLMLAEQYAKKEKSRAKELLIELLKYVDNRFTDEEEKVKLFPKISYLLSTLFLEEGDYDEVIVISKRAVNLLTTNGVIIGLIKNIDLYLEGLKHVNRMEEYTYLKNQRDALSNICEEYGYKVYLENMPVWMENTQKEMFLLHEFLAKARKRLHLSQEKMADIIGMDQKTISRIETGNCVPSTNTIEKLKSVLGLDREYYNCFITADDFRAYELRREISKKISLCKFDEAENIFRKLKTMLIRKSNVNSQYVKYMETLFAIRNKKISNDTAIKRYWDALRITLKNFRIEDLSSGILTRNEIFILNNIVDVLYSEGKVKEGIEIYEQILLGYERSKIDVRCHYVGESLILSNIASFYEETDQFDKALECCFKSINLELQCGRGNSLGKILTAKAFTLGRQDEITGSKENQKACQEYYKQAFWLSVLMKDNIKSNIIKNYYEKNYNNNIF